MTYMGGAGNGAHYGVVVDTVFDGTLPVHYGRAYVMSPTDVDSDLEDAFAGQRDGLLGASVPGQLWITTGLHLAALACAPPRPTIHHQSMTFGRRSSRRASSPVVVSGTHRRDGRLARSRSSST